MARCEDFPCCGHGSDPGGCPDFSRLNTCKGCRTKFHPDDLSYDYCYRCQAQNALDENGECAGCGGHGCPQCM